MTDKFIMVDLEDKHSKEIANVIANDTSRRILDYLSEHKANESEICRGLKLAPSTVNYNIKHLLKHNLIEVKDFFWSDKGNKVNIYTVSNKLIVIAPKKSEFKNRLKDLFGVLVLGGLISGVIYSFNKNASRAFDYSNDMLATKSALEMMLAVEETRQVIVPSASDFNIAVWFFLGVLFAVIIVLIISYFRRKK